MRNALLLLLGVTACGRSAASTVDDKKREAGTVTADERRRMEDSVHAWLTRVFHDWERGDSAALMATYLPGAGPLVSAGDGELYTSRDSVAAFLTGVSQTTGKHASFEKPLVDVLAPGVAAATYKIQFGGVNPNKEKFERRGVYSVVVVEREGHLHIVQEHQSLAPDTTAALAAINNVGAAFQAAYQRDDAAAIAALHTDDILFVNGGTMEEGRAKLEAGWKAELPSLSDLKITVLDRVVSGDLAAETIRFTQQSRNRGKAETDSGYAVSVLRRGPDGQWRYHVHALSRAHE